MARTEKTPTRSIFHVLPHEGADGRRWDLHKQGSRKHEYFNTQQEAVEGAHQLATGKAGHLVMHARDGHVYREYDFG
ncbi:MAG: DUF2188 domain-containing protein [Haloechinothrix sp.]